MGGSAVLFYLGHQLFGWGSCILGRAIRFKRLTILSRIVRESSMEEVIFDRRLERSEEVSYDGYLGRAFQKEEIATS